MDLLAAQQHPDLDAVHDHVAAASQIARGRYDILATASQVSTYCIAPRRTQIRQLSDFRQRNNRAHPHKCHAPPSAEPSSRHPPRYPRLPRRCIIQAGADRFKVSGTPESRIFFGKPANFEGFPALSPPLLSPVSWDFLNSGLLPEFSSFPIKGNVDVMLRLDGLAIPNGEN